MNKINIATPFGNTTIGPGATPSSGATVSMNRFREKFNKIIDRKIINTKDFDQLEGNANPKEKSTEQAGCFN